MTTAQYMLENQVLVEYAEFGAQLDALCGKGGYIYETLHALDMCSDVCSMQWMSGWTISARTLSMCSSVRRCTSRVPSVYILSADTISSAVDLVLYR